jgi:ATP-dependent Clp protease ATP-binding subunit ClpA
MKPFIPCASHNDPSLPSGGLASELSHKLIGQQAAITAIVPFVQMHQASLAPEDRPVGVFLLLGPTGTGKTRTVEALAEALHGSPKKILKVDCGEYQMEHEIAKLTGAPPGYLGHRETQPLLNQQKLSAAASEDCDLSIVLFDEIEKAAPSMTRLLLGVFDKGTLRLGDNTTVDFEKTLIFMTSNLGARAMQKQIRPDFGFEALAPRLNNTKSAAKLQGIGMAAVKRRFPPEFVNRLDAVVTYQPLDSKAMSRILDQQLDDLQRHIDHRLGLRSFRIEIPEATRRFLLKRGTSVEYGARELKRTLVRLLTQPLAARVSAGSIQPGGLVRVECAASREKLIFRTGDERLAEFSAA